MASSSELQPIGPNPDSGLPQQPEVAQREPLPITDEEVGEYREQDRFLPIANISRIMKNSVPSTSKISKDAKEVIQESISEFISFVTSEAADRAGQEKRKTIGGEDILQAMSALGFDNYVETLKIHLARLRAEQNNASQTRAQQAHTRHETDDTEEGDEDEM